MLATINSLVCRPPRRRGKAFLALAVLVSILAAFSAAAASTNSAGMTSAPERARSAFNEARQQYEDAPSDPERTIKFAQACFDLAEAVTRDKEREQIANRGITVCRALIARSPKLPAGHYYLGMNLGQLARTKSLGALKLVEEMEHEFETTVGLDANFDFAGPHRNLGLLYYEAPSWPASIGSKSKARQHLERAVTLSPKYPENHLNLLEAYLKWNDKIGARRELAALRDLLPQAKKEFNGDAWSGTWKDWDFRWQNLRNKTARIIRDEE